MTSSLVNKIKQRIQDSGPVPFDDFMQMALYAPSEGYYCRSDSPLGAKGDFSTAPLFSKYFSVCLANQVHQICHTQNWDTFNIVEFGPGDGTLARDLLQHLQTINAPLPKQYTLVEKSEALCLRQQQKLSTIQTDIKFNWSYPFKDMSPNTIVIANELLDAFPVKRFEMTDKGLMEIAVTLENDRLVEVLISPSPMLVNHLNWTQQRLKVSSFPVGYRSEANLGLSLWLKDLSQVLNNGVVIIVDYGYPTAEYYHPDRTMGTLLCHYQHKSYDDPLIRVGEQDITAHVDFGHVVNAAIEYGFNYLGFTTQAGFLLGNGLLDIPDVANDVAQVQMLTHPNLMGEAFKVLALGVSETPELQAFSIVDHSHRLN